MSSNEGLMRVRGSALRARVLIVLAAAACALCGGVAIVGEGATRIAFGAAAIVLAATAIFCAFAAWFDRAGGAAVDFETLQPESPVPQSPVTLIHDPGVLPHNALQATRETRAPEL